MWNLFVVLLEHLVRQLDKNDVQDAYYLLQMLSDS